MTRRALYLSRSDVQQQQDRPTDSLILRYVGSDIEFDDNLYGYPDGTFFAVQLAEIEWPEHIEALAIETGVQIDALPEAKKLQRATAEALAAGAMVDAPDYIRELTDDVVPDWSATELRDLERRHRIAEARVLEASRLVEMDLKLRGSGLKRPTLQLPRVEDFLDAPPPLFARTPEKAEDCAPVVIVERDIEPQRPEPELGEEEGQGHRMDEVLAPGSLAVKRALAAIAAAREDELPQRFPAGVRRKLRKMPAGQYVVYGELVEVRADLCGALADARALARKDKESVVIDYDGEWPVVVRRYGQGGRTVYRVEEALRRYGIEVGGREAGGTAL